MIEFYILSLLTLLLPLTSLYFAYKLLFKNEHRRFSLYLSISFLPVFLALFLFVGYFYSANILFPIVSIILIISLYLLFKKYSKKLAILVSIGTFLIVILTLRTGFEENYCWDKGVQADPTGTKMVKATKADIKLLGNMISSKEGDEIGVSFRIHMLCHQDFNLVNAIREKYLFP